MSSPLRIQALVAFLIFAIVLAKNATVTAPSNDAFQDQMDFLSEFYDLTSGTMWKNNSNWLKNDNETTICDWYGITCAGKWVQKISLKSNGLGGPLPNKWERIPYLDSIDLTSNRILGTIPASLGNLSLTNLILSGNAFSGSIPSTLGNIGSKLLYLDNNKLTGTLPASLANNPLVGLTLDLNKLSGTVPSKFGDIGSQFMVVSASFNDFTGVLPSGLCKANACNFQYNAHLGCPANDCKCGLQSCNCGIVCYTSTDCAGGSCSSCSTGPWGYKTCGGK